MNMRLKIRQIYRFPRQAYIVCKLAYHPLEFLRFLRYCARMDTRRLTVTAVGGGADGTRVVYTSHIRCEISELLNMAHMSVDRNKRRQITGVMYLDIARSTVTQIIEGPTTEVTALMERIQRDRRHFNVNMVGTAPFDLKTGRTYSGWRMTTGVGTHDSEYLHLTVVGAGSCGRVTHAIHTASGTRVAIKTIQKSRRGHVQSMVAEVAVLKQLNNNPHRRVVQLLGCFQDSHSMSMVMDVCENGDLYSLVQSQGAQSTQTSKFAMRQIISGLSHVHECNIVHRDIKLENILIDHNGLLKICDFGSAIRITSSSCQNGHVVGTPVYFAPEVFTRGVQLFTSDIWAVGVILYELVFGEIPWASMTDRRAIFRDISDGAWLSRSKTCGDNDIVGLLGQLCIADDSLRPGATQVMEYMREEWSDVTDWESVEKDIYSSPLTLVKSSDIAARGLAAQVPGFDMPFQTDCSIVRSTITSPSDISDAEVANTAPSPYAGLVDTAAESRTDNSVSLPIATLAPANSDLTSSDAAVATPVTVTAHNVPTSTAIGAVSVTLPVL